MLKLWPWSNADAAITSASSRVTPTTQSCFRARFRPFTIRGHGWVRQQARIRQVEDGVQYSTLGNVLDVEPGVSRVDQRQLLQLLIGRQQVTLGALTR